MLELNRLYNMDCMDLMKQFPDKHFELAIVDPPYGIKESGSNNYTRSKLTRAKDYKAFYGKDANSPSLDYFTEVLRVSKHSILFGANHYISKIPYDSSCWIVWDKDNGNSDYADCELAWTNFKCSVKKFKFRWHGMLQENMKDKEIRIHPTQKPVALYDWILSKFAKHGDKILDTHAGSASSLIACYNAGFDFIGAEIDKYYYDKANERLQAVMAQTRLF